MTADLSKDWLDSLQEDLRRPYMNITREEANRAITALRAEIERLSAENDGLCEAIDVGEDGHMWRFWAKQAQEAQARATAAEAALAAAMEGAVRVKSLEWSDCSTRYADDSGRKIAFGIGPILSGYTIFESPSDGIHVVGDTFSAYHQQSIEAAKAVAQADYERRIRAALEPNPAAQDRDALIAATLADIAQRADDAADQYEKQGNKHAALALRLKASGVRSLATQPQTDALAARDAKMRAEGMRKAAEMVVREKEVWADPLDHNQGTVVVDAWYSFEQCRDAILAAAQKEAGA